MKTKRFTYLFTILLCIAILPYSALADNAVGAFDIGGIVASYGAVDVQSFLDTTVTEGAGESTDFFAIALRARYSGLDFTAYADALQAYRTATTPINPVSRERIALAMLACGACDAEDPFVVDTADTCIGALGIMSEVFGLHLLTNGVPSNTHTVEEAAHALLARQHADGSFSVTGNSGDVDTTAMTVTALAACCTMLSDTNADVLSAAEVSDAIEAAIDWLAAKKTADGQFASYGAVNAESGAQVLIALAACGMDPAADARFADVVDGLLAFQTADGGFSHLLDGEKNDMATVQVFCAMVALWRIQNGYGPLYRIDDAALPEYVSIEAAEAVESATDTPETDTAVTIPAADPSTQPAESVPLPETGSAPSVVCIVRLVCSGGIVIACTFLLILQKKRGRKHIGNYLLPVGCAVVLLIGVWCIRITSVSQYYRNDYNVADPVGSVTITIRCDLVAGEADYIPADGILLAPEELPISSGDTVYDVLLRAAQVHKLSIDARGSDSYTYVAGIGYLYELAFGDLSGWVYRVNGTSPTVGCGAYTVEDGDTIEWLYTCDLGTDLAIYDGGVH